MITTSRVSLSAPHELLSYVPALVGFRPSDSLVLVVFRDQSSCGAMRIDLRPFLNDETIDAALAAALDSVVRIPRATGVLPVVYTTERCADGGRIPHENVARVLAPAIENRGLAVVDILCVAADAWGSYLDDSCLGHDLALLEDPQGLPAGSILDADAELTFPLVDDDAYEAFARATAAIASGDAGPEPAADDGAYAMDESADFLKAMASYVEEGAHVLDAELALIAHVLTVPSIRDVVAYSWAWGIDVGTHLWNRVFTPEQFTIDSVDDPWMYAFAGRIDVRPDPERLRAAIQLLKRLCALQHPDARVPGLTLISWCYWALGLSSFAHAWQRRAVETDGTYGLAIIMGMILDAGTIPDWAFYDPHELTSASEHADGPNADAAGRSI
ncbi:DUF4192 family protein [Paramicrobacterium agarici]|uniref:Uncharacterized protein DUF4192 n=1 Tax=Paramicrobacterium agarici TaxID=630514 RepID=A0A2A9DX46_9MICO|nr:DUF4192 family protein [Microbacterium agarici]PFG30946.1 uncharacterized protein DUF4192 [Microbacterium agarici]